MNPKTIAKKLTPHLHTAEEAVANVKDPRLREIAFGRILDHLLGTGHNNPDHTSPSGVEKRPSGKIKAKPASTGVMAWLKELVGEGFFSEPRSMNQIIEELNNRSHHLKAGDLTKQMQLLCHAKLLRRRKQPSVAGGKVLFHWSNW